MKEQKIVERKENMNMKLNDILVLNDTLRSIIDKDKDSKIDALFKFKLLGIMKHIEIPVTNFDVIKNEKIREYGSEDDNGNISISQNDKEALKKFSSDINKILDSDVEVTIEKIKAKDVFDTGVSSEYLVRLYAIMEE